MKKLKLNLFLGTTLSLMMLTSCSSSSSDTASAPAVVTPTSPTIATTPSVTTPSVTTPNVVTPDVTSAATTVMVRGTTEVELVVLTGPTGLGAASLLIDNMDDATANPYNVSVLSDNNEVVAMLASGEADIAALSTSVAANLYNKTEGISVLAVNTLGVLYLVEKGDVYVSNIEELAGQTIWATGQGANPEYILNKLLTEAGMIDQVTVEWMSSAEVSAKMASEENGICMLPVPASTALLLSDDSYREAVDMTVEWERLVGSVLPMGCMVVRNEFLAEYPNVVSDFMEDYRISMGRMKEYTETYARYAVETGIVPSLEIAMEALPKANLAYETHDDMQQMLESYYQVMFEADPDSIGGAMPYDDFYYYG